MLKVILSIMISGLVILPCFADNDCSRWAKECRGKNTVYSHRCQKLYNECHKKQNKKGCNVSSGQYCSELYQYPYESKYKKYDYKDKNYYNCYYYSNTDISGKINRFSRFVNRIENTVNNIRSGNTYYPWDYFEY